MKEPDLLVQTENLFSSINKSLFSERIQKVPISVSPQEKFLFSWKGNHLKLGSGAAYATKEKFFSSMCHEMIHIFNHQQRIVDVGRNFYHKNAFADCALSIGFIVVKHKAQGWSFISTEVPRNALLSQFIRIPFKENNSKMLYELNTFQWDGIDRSILISNSKNKKSFFLKYECDCPSPYNSVRCGRGNKSSNPFHAKCLVCGGVFKICDSN
jgi:hypothetical protein